MNQPCHLYRVFGSDGSLLYVGVSIRIGGRVGAHQTQTAWWTEAATISLTLCESRDEALYREAEAIETEKPRYNVRRERAHTDADYVHAVFEAPTDLYEAFRETTKANDETMSQAARRFMREYVAEDAA